MTSSNGKLLNLDEYRDFLLEARAGLFDRKLIEQTAVAAPDDETGRTGTVGHNLTFTALSNGVRVKATVVAVLSVVWEDGRRKVKSERSVFKTETL